MNLASFGQWFGCGTFAGAGPTDEALLVSPDFGGIRGQLYRASDGVNMFRGGGGGRGGSAVAPCALLSNAAFAFRLRDAIPSTTTFLALAGRESPFTCGVCTLIPELASAVFLPAATNPLGDAELRIVAPRAIRGIPLSVQWATINSTAPVCGQFPLDFANALLVVME